MLMAFLATLPLVTAGAHPLPVGEVKLRPALVQRHDVIGEGRAFLPTRLADRVTGEHRRAPRPVIGIVATLGRRPARGVVGQLVLPLVLGTARLSATHEVRAAG